MHAIQLTESAVTSDLVPDGFSIGLTGLQVTGQPTFEQWVDLMTSLAGQYDRLKWIIADAMAYGDDAYGDDIYQLVDDYWQPQTIANYTSTARRIPLAERNPDVVFSIHSEVASLDAVNRKHALGMVAAKVWNREDVRQFKRDIKGTAQPVEQTITLQWKGHTVKDGMLTAVFVAPENVWDIVGFQAIVRKREVLPQAVDKVAA